MPQHGYEKSLMEQTDPAAHETREIHKVIERLQERFPGVSQERVRAAVTEAHGTFEGSHFRDFVRVFVESVGQPEPH